MPACNYTSFYSATVELKENGPSAPEIKYELANDGAMVGEPPFVWVDELRWKIVFDAADETLVDNTYQVHITKHILTNSRVQDKFFKFVKPFDVTVVGKLPEFTLPNNAPDVENHKE